MKVTDEMVNSFLSWRLPPDFSPDGGIGFQPVDHYDALTHLWPIGTNLLTADQTRAMLERVLSVLEPGVVFVEAAKRFAAAHVNSDRLDALDDAGSAQKLDYEAADREYNASKAALVAAFQAIAAGPLTLDDDRRVFFYEQDNYPLSNFSSFRLTWAGVDFDTSEHAYHWYRFNGVANMHQDAILKTRSAHEAFRYAQANKAHQRPEWDEIKVGVMSEILRAKVRQHDYVRRKLLATGERELIENSWRDPFWGWGPNRDGKNVLGQLWMEVRAELRRSKDSTNDRETTTP